MRKILPFSIQRLRFIKQEIANICLKTVSADAINMPKKQEDTYGAEETQQRLRKMLGGAFADPPTALKDMPKRSGGARKPKGRASASASAKPRGREAEITRG